MGVSAGVVVAVEVAVASGVEDGVRVGGGVRVAGGGRVGMGDEVAVAATVAGSIRAVVGGMVAVAWATADRGGVQAVRTKRNTMRVIQFIVRPMIVGVGLVMLKSLRGDEDRQVAQSNYFRPVGVPFGEDGGDFVDMPARGRDDLPHPL